MTVFRISTHRPATLKMLLCVLLVAGLAGCEKQPISKLTPKQVIEAVRGGNAPKWEDVVQEKVRWDGTVQKVVMIHGDDYVKEFYLRFDPGFGAGAIAEVGIKPSQETVFKPGQKVTVTAIVLSHEKETGQVVVKLGSAEVK